MLRWWLNSGLTGKIVMESPEPHTGTTAGDRWLRIPPASEGLGEVVARVAGNSRDLESLTRPLLEALAKLAKLESTYLVVFDWAGSRRSGSPTTSGA